MIKNGLKYAEEIKELTNLQVKSFKENLIKFKNDLIMKNRINNRIKKDFDGYYGKIKFKGVKDILMKKKMSLHMKISDIYLMNPHLKRRNERLNILTRKNFKEKLISLIMI